MANGDITAYKSGAFGEIGSRTYVVASGAAASINPGEPVTNAVGGVAVTAMATNKPVVATDFLAGISSTTSTDTVAAAGVVEVQPLVSGQVWLISPNDSTDYDTQAEYNALVGKRVLLDLTGGSYTILATDGSTSGCVIQYMDITENPGKVAFSFRNGVSYLT